MGKNKAGEYSVESKNYTQEESEFLKKVQQYRVAHKRNFITLIEAFRVMKEMGYERAEKMPCPG